MNGSVLGHGGRRWAVVCGAAVVATLKVGAPTAWAAPQPVSQLSLGAGDAAKILVGWKASPDTTSATVCWTAGDPPASVDAQGATCSAPISVPPNGDYTFGSYQFDGVEGTTYGVSVFAGDANSGYSSPVSSSVTAKDPPPVAPLVTSVPAGETSLQLTWDQSPAGCCAGDIADVLVSWTRDGASSPDGTAVVATDGYGRPSAPYRVTGLAPLTTYMFAVRYRDRGAHVSDAGSVRAQTRVAGVWLADRDPHGVLRTSHLNAGDVDRLSVATVSPNGDLVAAYHHIVQTKSTYSSTLRVVDRTRGRWHVHYTTFSDNASDPVAATAGNVSVVAWTTPSGNAYRINYLTHVGATWSAVRHVSVEGVAVAAAVDPQRRLHFLTAGSRGGYITVVGSRITRSTVPGGWGYALARDAVTGRIVLAYHRRVHDSQQLTIATASASATKFGPLSTWLTTPEHGHGGAALPVWHLDNVSVVGGRIYVAMQRGVLGYPAGSDGNYIAVGSTRSHHGPLRVAESRSDDTEVAVTAISANTAVLVWKGPSPSAYAGPWPSSSRLGIWQSTVSLTNSRWIFTHKRHWTSSPYDHPIGIYAGTRGHRYVAFIRQPVDLSG